MAVTVTPSTATLYAGDRLQLVGTTTGSAIVWTSSDASVTVVAGLASCLVGKGVGAVTITATSDAGTATCVLTTYGISTSYVASKIGLASSDVGRLCSSTKVNPGSLYKPIVNTALVGPANIYSATGDTFFKTNGGLNKTIWTDTQTLTQFLTQLETSITPWSINLPNGGAAEPYRLGDFRGYQHTLINTSGLFGTTTIGTIGNLVTANPTTYSESWVSGAGAIVRSNWDRYILENTAGTNVLQFDDIWMDGVVGDALSTFYLTCVVAYPEFTAGVTKYYAKSFGLMSAQTTNGGNAGIDVNIGLETLFTLVDTTVGRKLWTLKPNIKRYYFLTSVEVKNYTTGGWYELTTAQINYPKQMATNATNGGASLWGTKVCEIPLMAEGVFKKFYIVNNITMGTYIRPTVVNDFAVDRPFTVKLQRYIGAGAKTQVDSYYFIVPASSSVNIGLNNITNSASPSDGTAYLYNVDIEGVNDREFVDVLNSSDQIVGSFSKYSGTMTLDDIDNYLGNTGIISNWKNVVWKWKIQEGWTSVTFQNDGTASMALEIHGEGSQVTLATVAGGGSQFMCGQTTGDVHFHFDVEYNVKITTTSGSSLPAAIDEIVRSNNYTPETLDDSIPWFQYVTLTENTVAGVAWYKFKLKEGIQGAAIGIGQRKIVVNSAT